MLDNNKLIPAFSESLFNNDTQLVDLIEDFSEMTIDTIIDNEVIEAIPFVKIVKALAKTSISIKERQLIKNTLAFLQGFISHGITEDELQKYRNKYIDTKHTEKEIERILLLLDRHLDAEKSTILVNIYANLVLQNIEWDEFVELSDILDGLMYIDIIGIKKTRIQKDHAYTCIERLLSLGLVRIKRKDFQRIALHTDIVEYEDSPLMTKFIQNGFS